MIAKRLPIREENLEHWLKKRTDKSFPFFDRTRGEVCHQDRYSLIKTELAQYHNAVEKGALLASAKEWAQSAKLILKKNGQAKSEKSLIAELDEISPFIYLNNHGTGHVERVIQRCSELLSRTNCELTSYEGYLLLCAIQFHDVGNIYGRKEHEKKCRDIMEKHCRHAIRDSFERNAICRIAMAHSGCWGEDPDTIASLFEERMLGGCPVRERLLAALLRFSDELADDCTRSDRIVTE